MSREVLLPEVLLRKVLLRKVLGRIRSACAAGMSEIDRCLDRAGNDADPSLWRLRPGAEAAFDMSPPDETESELRDRTNTPTF
jgi:hypothetical protein